MAHAMGADSIEQDVVMTRDGQLIVLHDLWLDAVTDVADRFPGRARSDGRHYALDFTIDEIRTLRVHERLGADGAPVFPGRFPASERMFRVPTLDEEIRLIQGLNRSTGRTVGVYVEPKAPAWHAGQGRDLLQAVLARLAAHGLSARGDPVHLQSFDLDALRRVRLELGSDLKLVQLIGENQWRESATDFDHLRTERGLRDVAAIAQGVGPMLSQVIEINDNRSCDISDFTPMAHRLGLFVHAYTLRADALPAAVGTLGSALQVLIGQAGLDGVFTDHPDQVVRCLSGR